MPPLNPLDHRRPSKQALEWGLVWGWRGPEKDFTGTDELDVQRQGWIHDHSTVYLRGVVGWQILPFVTRAICKAVMRSWMPLLYAVVWGRRA